MKRREYLTNLSKRHSITALIAAILTVMAAFYGIIGGVGKTMTVLGKDVFYSFIYFTMITL